MAAIHAHAEKFEPRTEMYFEYIQIFTAIVDSFAHGANDVAIAMGPYMAIWSIYHSGVVSKKTSDDYEDDSLWILALGGIGIGVGLCLYGYQIIQAIGVKTHCQVGATTGVALLKGKEGVNTVGPRQDSRRLGHQSGSSSSAARPASSSRRASSRGSPTEGKVNVLLREDCPTWAPANGWMLNSTSI